MGFTPLTKDALSKEIELFMKKTSKYPVINDWDVSHITDMSFLFGEVINMNPRSLLSLFNSPIGKWNVSNVTNMSYMFANSDFNQPIGNWNVSKVTNMSYMFANSDFNQPIGNWNVSNVIYMSNMFKSAKFFNQPIGNWNVSNVTEMYYMFWKTAFNQPIGNWNVSKVTNMSKMFGNTTITTEIMDQDFTNWEKFPIALEMLKQLRNQIRRERKDYELLKEQMIPVVSNCNDKYGAQLNRASPDEKITIIRECIHDHIIGNRMIDNLLPTELQRINAFDQTGAYPDTPLLTQYLNEEIRPYSFMGPPAAKLKAPPTVQAHLRADASATSDPLPPPPAIGSVDTVTPPAIGSVDTVSMPGGKRNKKYTKSKYVKSRRTKKQNKKYIKFNRKKS